MPEPKEQGLSSEDDKIAKSLYNHHKSYGISVDNLQGSNDRGDEARRITEEAWENGTIEEVPHETQVVANGKITQRALLNTAQLNYDANLWRAHKHKEEHLDEYIQQGVKDAARGKEPVIIDLDPDSTNRRAEREKKEWTPLQALAHDYLITPDTPEEEREQKLSRGFSVSVDPKKALREIDHRTRPGGFVTSEERRETMGRDYVLGSHKEVSFWVATQRHGETHSTLGNSYGEWGLGMMKITDFDVVDAMKSYAKQELEEGRATEEAVTAFIARLDDTALEPIRR